MVRAERAFHVWLEKNGYDYDVISDHDLHLDPSLLLGYQILIINGHSEYWSKEAYNGVNVFERVTPAPAPSSGGQQGPLAGIDPRDPGVDLTKIAGSGLWKKLAGN